MKTKHLHLSGVSSHRLILLPEQRDDDRSEIGQRASRPRIRRYRLGVLTGAAPADASSRKPAVAPPTLARTLRA
ncbi:MAG TPA: hypothetical protein VH115_04860 [Solirubrobacteraceae bacterium]|jgi:hypothetical protein|nr:hypothetical protein [Solirubrobacteraceae bacterium]